MMGTQGFEASTDREQQLMGQVADGDREAFAELFDRVAPTILGVLVRLLGQRTLAEEALQETFLQGWLQALHYRPELGSPRAWLLNIARSRGLDCLRRERARDRREEAAVAWTPELDVPVGTERLETLQLRARLREGLVGLPAAQRACIALAFGKDLAHPAIARELAMPLGSVKSRIRLGMRRLARDLEAGSAELA
ncbi:MAG TPA: sigma-70 family RNA polymerase sigma factor [Thermoanaerobaculia bacterium]|nr:sigma-70 family RNA polymerase sigma factor [Thermoanaerobaculia bacterium]